jgi:hypothetical protein
MWNSVNINRLVTHGVITFQIRIVITAPVIVIITSDPRIIAPTRIARADKMHRGKGMVPISIARSTGMIRVIRIINTG